MTNSKPTPGPWYFIPYPSGKGGFVLAGEAGVHPLICDLSKHELPEANGQLIAEAGTVFHETNLTPRQLLEQRDELLSVVQNIGVYGCGMLSQPAALQVSEELWAKLRAAEMESVARDVYFKIVDGNKAAKCGKVGG